MTRSYPTASLSRLVRRLRAVSWEAYVWLAALLALGATNPSADGLLDLCLFKALGLPGCPGCGLGHAIAHLLHGDWLASWQAHPLGGPALILLAGRVLTLMRPAFSVPSPTT